MFHFFFFLTRYHKYVHIMNVQKMNDQRSKNERKRSKNERYRSKNERHKKGKKVSLKKEEGNSDSDLKELNEKAIDIINFLNEYSGRNFSTAISGRGSDNVKMVKAIFKKGYTEEEVKLMIQFKCWEWKGNAKMEKHLQPVTIFQRHGTTYIEQAIEAKENPAFAAVLKAAKESETNGSGKPSANGMASAVADRLKTW